MPAKHSRHIALTGPLAAWIDRQVAEGHYTSASDVVRAAVRLLRAQANDSPRPSPSNTVAVPLTNEAVEVAVAAPGSS